MGRGRSGAESHGAELGPASDIPDKLYFKIGEVAQLVGVQAHVLRYWEKEVPSVRPAKSASRQRRYRRRDVELFREIRRLLHDDRYTLAGVRKCLSKGAGAAKAQATAKQITAVPGDIAETQPTRRTFDDATLERVRGYLVDLIRLAETDDVVRARDAAEFP